jgi:hypothetical protein
MPGWAYQTALLWAIVAMALTLYEFAIVVLDRSRPGTPWVQHLLFGGARLTIQGRRHLAKAMSWGLLAGGFAVLAILTSP